MSKETAADEKAREGGFFDRARMGYEYMGKPAESEEGTLRIKQGGEMVEVPGTAKAGKSAQHVAEMVAPIDANVTNPIKVTNLPAPGKRVTAATKNPVEKE